MILSRVMDEIGDVADTIDGLHVYRYPADEITPPAAMVTYPEAIEFDAAFQRGTDQWTGGLLVAGGRVWDRAARDQMSRYVSGDGAESIKAAFYAHDWQSCAYVRPVRATFDAIQVAGVEYIAALFELQIAGNGTEET